MIGYLNGQVVFSDGEKTILGTASGVGYELYFQKVISEGQPLEVFISHYIREAGEELYAFETLREKKLFELLLKVKGVGPKSAYAMISLLGEQEIIQAIFLESKEVLKKVPGIGAKAAAQVILDLKDKIGKMEMYVNLKIGNTELGTDAAPGNVEKIPSHILNDALMACKELGFSEDQVIKIAKGILSKKPIKQAEELVHLVLKEI